MRTLNQDERDDIERLVDAYGIDSILSALTDICGLKAAHVAESWQDTALAKRWDKLATALDKPATLSEGL